MPEKEQNLSPSIHQNIIILLGPTARTPCLLTATSYWCD